MSRKEILALQARSRERRKIEKDCREKFIHGTVHFTRSDVSALVELLDLARKELRTLEKNSDREARDAYSAGIEKGKDELEDLLLS